MRQIFSPSLPILTASLALATAFAAAPAARADVKLPPVISDHMVLQRDVAAPLWGTASPGEEITVTLAGQTKSTKADDKGNWRVNLDPLKVGDPLTLTIKGKNTLTIQDVLVGEVWADAVIDGDSVIVSSAAVPKPTAVRYAWASQHPWANLFNKDGLPAQTFRTDE